MLCTTENKMELANRDTAVLPTQIWLFSSPTSINRISAAIFIYIAFILH